MKITDIISTPTVTDRVNNSQIDTASLADCDLVEVAATPNKELTIYNLFRSGELVGSLEGDAHDTEFYPGCDGSQSELMAAIRTF